MTYADAYNLRTGSVSFNNVADAIDGTLSRQWGGTSTGSANTYAVTCSPAWAAYESGRALAFVPNVSNTGATTINVNGLGARTVRYKNQALVGGELVAGVEALLVYDGTIFELINHGGGWATWTPSYTQSGSMTFTSITTNVSRYQRHGNRVDYMINAVGTLGGTAAPGIDFTLPIARVGNACGANGFTSNSGLAATFCFHGTGVDIQMRKYDGANFVIGTTASVVVTGFYAV